MERMSCFSADRLRNRVFWVGSMFWCSELPEEERLSAAWLLIRLWLTQRLEEVCTRLCVISVVSPSIVDANAIIANTHGYLLFVEGCFLAALDDLTRGGPTFPWPEVYIPTKNSGQSMLRPFDLAGNNITSPVPRGVSWSCRLFSEIREQTPSSISSASRVSLGSPVFVRQLLITVNENRATGGRPLIYPFNPLLHHEYGN